ncbi:ATP-binding cassette domain-containing protein [Aestuariivirga litoralis]|uniref:ATP-binding cassette domain-containing protein n=1 Tax=Aestuariivirga litoralis TaxID=2650924 RepID=UPI0018C61EA6|nr:ATP-binding cassette domain-containing protein [Aestuariivirga litoralis]MBG1230783.1 ATP-binding cassette domain-containing protein [Aestuariivirga litoralis]
MKLDRRLLFSMIGFLWLHAPMRLKYALIVLAITTGFSRDFLMVVVNKAAGSDMATAFHIYLPVFVALLGIFVVATYNYHVLVTAANTEVVNNVRLKLIRRLLNAAPTVIESHKRGFLYHILTTDVNIVASTSNMMLTLLPLFIFLVVAIPQLFFYSWIAGLFSVAVMLGGVLAYYVQQKSMAALGVDVRRLEVEYFEGVSGMIDGYRETKLNHARRNSFVADVAANLNKLRLGLISTSRVYETGEVAVSMLKFLLFAGIVFLAPWLHETAAQVTFSVLTLVLFCMTPFEQIISSYPSTIASLVSFSRIEALDAELGPPLPLIEDASKPKPFESLQLRKCKARYKAQQGRNFDLGPIDLTIKRGDVVFLVGANGSGKTTLLNVIAGLHEPVSGERQVNGETLSPNGLDEYRARISAVFARYHVFRKLFGLEHVPDTKVSEMMNHLNLRGETGCIGGQITRMEMSSGQKRRLALVVSLLEDRDILILDEFLSDQDQTQRVFFFETLLPELKAKGKTVILATHDLNWAKACDQLVTLADGKIVSVTHPREAAVPA